MRKSIDGKFISCNDIETQIYKDIRTIESKELRECLDTVHEAIQKHSDEVPREVYNAFYDSVAKFRENERQREEMIKEYSRAVNEMAWYGKGDMLKIGKMAKKLGRLSVADDLAESKLSMIGAEESRARSGAKPGPFTR